MCGSNCCKGCGMSMTVKYLVVIGGLNWGLVGLGMLFGQGNWNVVNLLLGSVMWLEALVYVLVGLAAVAKLFGCKCSKCKSACGASCNPGGGEGGQAEGSM